jgi:hypothetical protein
VIIKDLAEAQTGELAEGKPVTIDAHGSVLRIDHKVRRLPGVNRLNLIGVVSQADVAQALAKYGRRARRGDFGRSASRPACQRALPRTAEADTRHRGFPRQRCGY